MSERLIREQLSPEEKARRASHRHAIAEALNIARQYDGTEDAYVRLMAKLEAVEEGVKGFGFSGDIRSQDTEAALRYTSEKTPRDVDAILEVASDSQRRLLALERTEHPYVYERYKGLILQPGNIQQSIVAGDGENNFEARFDAIVHDFIELLKQHKIYADDLIITIGAPPSPNMMRQESYIKIEIPRLRKTVLLCNQIGEATFIIQGYIPNVILSKYTKEDFKDNPLYPTRRIIRGESWSSDVSKYLFKEEAWGEQKGEQVAVNKVNVKDVYELRIRISEQIRKQYTPEKWLKMNQIEAKKIKIDNQGITALARIFGMKGEPYLTLPRLRLGAVIWPESQEIIDEIKIEERTPIEWQKAIKQNGWTPERWLKMSKIDASSVIIDKRALRALATIFGVEGNARNILPRLHLGAVIWPESLEIAQAIKIEERTPIQWREAIQQNGWTPDKWLKMSQRSACLFKVDNRGLTALARIFGMKSDPLNNTLFRLRLGAAIWPESREIAEAIERIEHLEKS